MSEWARGEEEIEQSPLEYLMEEIEDFGILLDECEDVDIAAAIIPDLRASFNIILNIIEGSTSKDLPPQLLEKIKKIIRKYHSTVHELDLLFKKMQKKDKMVSEKECDELFDRLNDMFRELDTAIVAPGI